MAESAVTMRFFGNSADAERAIVALEKKYSDLENKIAALSRKSKKSNDESIAGMAMTAIKAGLAAKSVQKIADAYVSVQQAQGAYRKEAEQTAFALDEVIRKFRVQAGLANVSSPQARELASRQASAAGVSQQTVLRAATELASQGFSSPLQTGGAEAVVAFLQAFGQNADTADIEGIIKGAAQQLSSAKQDLNTQNLLTLLQKTQALKDTPFQAPDLATFASARATANAVGIDETTFLSAASMLLQRQEAAQGSTGFTKLLTSLSAPNATVLGALKEGGISPESVDFIGEALPEVLSTISKARAALPENRRLPFLSGLVGNEKSNLTALQTLLDYNAAGAFQERAAMQQNTQGFEDAVNAMRGGGEHALRRLDALIAEEESKLVDSGGIPVSVGEKARELANLRARRQMLESGENTKLFFYDMMQHYFGDELPATESNLSPTERAYAEQAMQSKGDFEMGDILGKIEKNTRPQKNINRDAHREAAN